jgi:transposase
VAMTTASRKQALEAAGLAHPNPEAVTASLFQGGDPFFLVDDKVQVKYEMLRAHVVDGASVTSAAAAHGYSRPAFYLVAAAFDERGMAGLIDERRGRRGPLKMSAEIEAFIVGAEPTLSGAQLAARIAAEFGVSLHRRTIERVRTR